MERDAKSTTDRIGRILEAIGKGENPYHNFVKTYEECLADDVVNGKGDED